MTQTQVAYLQHLEQQRQNERMLQETKRHNMALEDVELYKHRESKRHNKATEITGNITAGSKAAQAANDVGKTILSAATGAAAAKAANAAAKAKEAAAKKASVRGGPRMGAFIDINSTFDATNKQIRDAMPKSLDEFASQVIRMSGETISPQAKVEDLLRHAYGDSFVQPKREELNDAIASQDNRKIFKFVNEILVSYKSSGRRGRR